VQNSKIMDKFKNYLDVLFKAIKNKNFGGVN
jgi:hypothetical protein